MSGIPPSNLMYLGSGLSASDCSFMFYNCKALRSFTWPHIDLSRCESISSLLDGCSSLASVTLNMNTENIKYMAGIFYNCNSITSIDLTSFDTSNVTLMNYMFAYCTKLEEIICPDGFDMRSCGNVDFMFNGCSSYNGEPLHFKNMPRSLNFTDIGGTEYTHYIIDNFID